MQNTLMIPVGQKQQPSSRGELLWLGGAEQDPSGV
jgi:hypothetical protein